MTSQANNSNEREESHSPRILEKRQRVREALLDCGGRLFADRGMDQVSVEEIIADAGISRRTFYSHFANKFELAAGVIQPALEDGTGLLQKVAGGPAGAMLSGIVDCYQHLWHTHGNALLAISKLSTGVMPYLEESHRAFGTQVRAVLARAEQEGELRNNDAACSFSIITRTAVPLLKIYAGHPDGDELYRASMLALLRTPEQGQ